MGAPAATLTRPKRIASLGGSNVLWRLAEWRCEYAPNTRRSSGGTVSLYMGAARAAQHETHSLDEMLRVSSLWRQIILGPHPDPLEKLGMAPIPDRRQGPATRRRSSRGGRRLADVS
jgi:hypothetical protein